MAMFKKPAQPKAAPANGGASVTDTAPCQKSVRIQVPPSEIAPVRGEVLAEFQRQTTMPGFRKGKAPADLVERQYGDDIQNETLRRVTRAAFERVATEHALRPVGPFEVSQALFQDADGLTLEATVEVEPSFPLSAYKGLKLARQPVTVTPHDMEQAIESLRESMAQLVPTEAGTPAQPPGEPAEPAEPVKERQLPPVDDELAKDLGFETLDTLKTHIDAKLREQKKIAQSQALEAALCDALLARHTFEVPAKLVSRQTDKLSRDFKTRLMMGGIPEEQIAKEMEQFAQELRTSAERHVKLAFILDRIASQESLQASQDELVKRLWQLSQRWKKDPVEVRKVLDAQGLWPSVISSIRQEKTIAFLLSAAEIHDAAVTVEPPREGGTA